MNTNMIHINGKTFLFDPEFEQEVKPWTWCVNHKGYAQTMLPARFSCTGKRETMFLHQLVMNLHYNIPLGDGSYLEYGYEIDHISHGITDNRIQNLRYLPEGMNNSRQNKSGKSSRFQGVSWRKDTNKWQAHIQYQGKSIGIGSYTSEIDAARAYDNKARELHVDRVLNELPVKIKLHVKINPGGASLRTLESSS